MTVSSERRLLVSYEAANNAGAPTSAVARDAALGGLFIETKTPLAVGSLLSVELSAPNTTATLEARVFSTRAQAEGPTKPAGMAVRFLDLPSGMLGKLQSILDHHRPPARTRMGVGDENEALWAAAGGRDEAIVADDEVLAIAASVTVDGRPTPEMPAPIEDPRPPRYPTPRMVPISRPLVAAAEAPSSASQPVWSPPSAYPSSSGSSAPLARAAHGPPLGSPTKSRAIPVVVALIVVVGVLAIVAAFAMRLR